MCSRTFGMFTCRAQRKVNRCVRPTSFLSCLNLRIRPPSTKYAATHQQLTPTNRRAWSRKRLGRSLKALGQTCCSQGRLTSSDHSQRSITPWLSSCPNEWTQKRFLGSKGLRRTFLGKLILFGSQALFGNNPRQNVTDASKFAPQR